MKFPVASLARASAATALLLGAAFGAQAQSSVHVYGLLDMSVGSFENAGGTKLTQAESGKMTTSFFALRGTEDLGGGLKAMFNLESFIGMDSGAVVGRTFWDRQANVGLSGNFGSVFLGNNTTALFVQGLQFNPFGSSMGFSPTMRHLFAFGGFNSVRNGRTAWNDSVIYTTPKFGGLSGSLQLAAPEGNGQESYAVSASYAAGALGAGIVVQNYRRNDFTTNAATDQTTWQASGSYDLGVAKLFGQYAQVKDDLANAKDKMFQVGSTVPLGGGAVLASYGELEREAPGAADVTDKILSVGYDYNLSKRTDVYAVYMNNKRTGLATGNTYAVGVRHRF